MSFICFLFEAENELRLEFRFPFLSAAALAFALAFIDTNVLRLGSVYHFLQISFCFHRCASWSNCLRVATDAPPATASSDVPETATCPVLSDVPDRRRI